MSSLRTPRKTSLRCDSATRASFTNENCNSLLSSSCNGALVSEWFKKNGISFHGYNGGGLDGRNSNKVLKKLNDLNIFVTENRIFASCWPFIQI